MRRHTRRYAAVLIASGGFMAACGHSHDDAAYAPATQSAPATQTAPATTASGGEVAPTDTTSYSHHSKLAGALVGAAAGHALGHHAMAGAVAGALVQHERNRHHH